MAVNSPLTPAAGSSMTRMRYRLYGLVFVLIAAMLAWLLIAIYNKTFTPFVGVTLNSNRAGLQLLETSDVKVRGLIVGEVRQIRATPAGAAIDLAIQPDKAPLIPKNVSARILPKTVFGEKYVELVLPGQSTRAAHIGNGDQIAQDRSATAVEIERVLNQLMPLLRAVKPEQLNATLNALAMALQGRGNEIGRQIESADALLRKINKELPTIVKNIKAVGDVAAVYDAAAPDLLRLLRNMMTVNNTLVEKGDAIDRVIDQGITVTDKNRRFLSDNENRIVGFGVANRGALAVLARYSPTLPCIMEGLAKIRPDLEDAVGGRQPGVHITVELVKPRPAYKPGLDTPRYADHRKPRCYGLPNPKKPFPNHQVLDGTEDDTWWAGRSLPGVFVDSPAGSVAEDQEMVKGLVAPMMQTPSEEVPDIATLLFGPVTHGSVVRLG
jgi:phospholipid/cholesterol/gamma-HCH transport system substrate-binding protein